MTAAVPLVIAAAMAATSVGSTNVTPGTSGANGAR
jgi:hypothetical protein